MPKEDRSDWVAVAPDASSAPSTTEKIKPAVSAYTYFQRDATEDVKAELKATFGKVVVAEFSKLVRNRWQELDAERKAHYEDLARDDQARFARESHAADVAAMERKERLRMERETLLLDDEGGTKRGTRGRRARKERKRERKERRKQKKQAKRKSTGADDEDFEEEDEESSDSYEAEDGSGESSDSYDSDDSERATKKLKKKKEAAPKRQQSQKQIENRQKKMEEKKGKEAVIAERQEDVRKEKANQAKRRLEFLLKQSNIFSHFGQVKQDASNYGIKTSERKSEDGTGVSRRDAIGDEQQEEDLDDADTHQATFLTSQPTTLAHGKMRQYQLEGLNWMIRLQENGVNGILADEVCVRL
jgi:SWI/SNF-related matrix-associated actin-dependent regulator of chromatin subfamily A member 5